MDEVASILKGRRLHLRTWSRGWLWRMNDDFTYMANRQLWGGGTTPAGLSVDDARHHCYIVGKTGSGKSTLLRNMIIQHIAQGHGVAVIDPHGDLADSLLDHIPPWRADHLCYFNPGDMEHPASFNVLAGVTADERHLLASGIVGAFKNIFPDSWGPRMEYIFHHAIAALAECPNATLLGVNRMLTDDAYRRWVIRQVTDPFVRDFWEVEFASYDARFRREAISPIQNKIGQLLQSPAIRNILGQVRSRISIPFIMDNQRIFIANLSKGKLGHDKTALLGSLLVSQFQLAAMARTNKPEEERRDFFLFVDEFQNFVTEAFASVLSEARKYRLCLTLAHQFTDQLSLPLRQAVFGNVGTLVSFRVGYLDAHALHHEFGEGFIPQQFVELGRYETILRLHTDGQTQVAFRAESAPPLSLCKGHRDKLVARSRERFTSPRAGVEEKLERWLKHCV
jgi:energy-coupling factor transporter ATP-binding protein EcfA2